MVTRDDLRRSSAEHGFTLTEDELDVAVALVGGAMAAVEQLVAGEERPTPPDDRRWWAPTRDDDPHAAWMVRCEVPPTGDGPLRGTTFAAKDNVQVAGLPMTNGSLLLDGYVAEVDATVVTRLLAAGSTLVGTTRCEQLCMSNGSHTGAGGPVHNPHRRGHTTGGSSSGSAAAVAAGTVDVAIGGDQGGSIRIPAAWCGIVGMKPTWGLVPYTGICRMEPHIDHAGPLTATVSMNAAALSVMAGPDGIDVRSSWIVPDDYPARLDDGVDGLTVGVLLEGFTHPRTHPGVAAAVRAAGERLAAAGARVHEVSVPAHAEVGRTALPLMLQGLYRTVLLDAGQGTGRPDLYLPGLAERMARWRDLGDTLSPAMKVSALIGAAVEQRDGARAYHAAANEARRARAAYDTALAQVDMLLLPTATTVAPPLPADDAPFLDQFLAATSAIVNTFPFDVTHHPAMSVPCGWVDGLPVGAMLVGRHWDEATLYRAAAVLEASAPARAGDGGRPTD